MSVSIMQTIIPLLYNEVLSSKGAIMTKKKENGDVVIFISLLDCQTFRPDCTALFACEFYTQTHNCVVCISYLINRVIGSS